MGTLIELIKWVIIHLKYIFFLHLISYWSEQLDISYMFAN